MQPCIFYTSMEMMISASIAVWCPCTKKDSFLITLQRYCRILFQTNLVATCRCRAALCRTHTMFSVFSEHVPAIRLGLVHNVSHSSKQLLLRWVSAKNILRVWSSYFQNSFISDDKTGAITGKLKCFSILSFQFSMFIQIWKLLNWIIFY